MENGSTYFPRRAAVLDALLRTVAERGLDHASVREVAAAAGVSIGTVQHYFPTKDEMLADAFAEVVRRVRARLEAAERGPDVRRNLSVVLRELLPLDEQRRRETRVMVAFAARATTSPTLADIQRAALGELHEAIARHFALAWGIKATAAHCQRAAHAVIALADGLALHALSTPGWLSARRMTDTLDLVVDALLVPDSRDR